MAVQTQRRVAWCLKPSILRRRRVVPLVLARNCLFKTGLPDIVRWPHFCSADRAAWCAQLLSRWRCIATDRHRAATPSLLEALGASAFRANLSARLPPAAAATAALPAAQLLALAEAEWRVAEVKGAVCIIIFPAVRFTREAENCGRMFTPRERSGRRTDPTDPVRSCTTSTRGARPRR
jgi:hypothetical protein